MKKSFQLLCLTFVVILVMAGIHFSSSFPVDSQPYVEKKYAGWNGVLQAWVCTRWSPDGGFIRWLNACASEFEKSHEGVYLEFTPVQEDTMRAMHAGGMRMPDLVFFSPGVISNSDGLTPLQPSNAVRSDLRDYGSGHALPVALSGYIWAYNSLLCDGAPQNPGELTALSLPEDQDGRSFTAALIGLLSDIPGGDEEEQIMPDTGIDLGLPASSEQAAGSEGALDKFIDGELPYIPVSSEEIACLSRLQESGRGPDWRFSLSGQIACSDQLLMAGIPDQGNEPERAALAEAFISSLLTDTFQAGLADIGAHSVTGQRIHSDFSVYAELDILLNSRPLWVPDCFSEYSVSNPATIVRGFLNGNFSAKNALSLMGFEGM